MRLYNKTKRLNVGCVDSLWKLTLSWAVLSLLSVMNTKANDSITTKLSDEKARKESLRTRPREARGALHLEDTSRLQYDDEQRQNDKFLKHFSKVFPLLMKYEYTKP